VRVQLEAETTIVDGLDVGPGAADSQDYAVRYTKYLVAIGHVRLARSQGGDAFEDDQVYLADLTTVGSEGAELVLFEDVPSGQWDEFSYETPAASEGALRVGNVSQADADAMVENGWTYWIEGVVERPDTQGGPVAFVIQTDVETLYTDCQVNNEPGLGVAEGRTSTAQITLHGDHLWFRAFPSASEGTIERRTAWIVAADTDGDGTVSTEDLATLDATEVFTSALGYDLGGGNFEGEFVIETALDFARAQLATQGHFRGEGECVWHFGGAEGDHDHDHDHDH
jgi:hypothetical protein